MKVAIIGAGNMGGAIALGLAAGTKVKEQDITVANPSRGKLDAIKAKRPGITTANDNRAAVAGADLVVLAVKPWKIAEVIDEIKPSLDYEKQLIASVAAGIGTEKLAAMLDKGDGKVPPIYYIIPNTAISVGSSMTFVASAAASKQQDELILSLFNELGLAMKVEERLMGAGTALASCGIAYAMRYIRAATEGGVELGFYAKDAQQIVQQTLKGAVDLLVATGNNPETEIDKVTTPGGITIRGLNEMEHAGFTSSVIRGLKASVK